MSPIFDEQERLTNPIQREVDVYVAMGRIRHMATQAGANEIDRTKLEIIVLELARNILAHANHNGTIEGSYERRNNRLGILVIASDRGPGIPDIDKALQDGYSTGGTLGAGLPGVKRLADHFEIVSALEQGTVIRAWKAITHGR